MTSKQRGSVDTPRADKAPPVPAVPTVVEGQDQAVAAPAMVPTAPEVVADRVAPPAAPVAPARPKVPTIDRVGMLNHLTNRYSVVDHQAEFAVAYANENGMDIRIDFSYEQLQLDGKWKAFTATATGMNIDDAAGNLAGVLARGRV